MLADSGSPTPDRGRRRRARALRAHADAGCSPRRPRRRAKDSAASPILTRLSSVGCSLPITATTRHSSLDLEPGIVVLAGENGDRQDQSPGSGLAAVARAVFVPAACGRAPYGDGGARRGAADGFAIHARLQGPFGDCQIGTGTVGNGRHPEEGGPQGARQRRARQIGRGAARMACASSGWCRRWTSLFTGCRR